MVSPHVSILEKEIDVFRKYTKMPEADKHELQEKTAGGKDQTEPETDQSNAPSEKKPDKLKRETSANPEIGSKTDQAAGQENGNLKQDSITPPESAIEIETEETPEPVPEATAVETLQAEAKKEITPEPVPEATVAETLQAEAKKEITPEAAPAATEVANSGAITEAGETPEPAPEATAVDELWGNYRNRRNSRARTESRCRTGICYR